MSAGPSFCLPARLPSGLRSRSWSGCATNLRWRRGREAMPEDLHAGSSCRSAKPPTRRPDRSFARPSSATVEVVAVGGDLTAALVGRGGRIRQCPRRIDWSRCTASAVVVKVAQAVSKRSDAAVELIRDAQCFDNMLVSYPIAGGSSLRADPPVCLRGESVRARVGWRARAPGDRIVVGSAGFPLSRP